jgi:dolichol-phosphate mannosyltransferase
VATDSLDSPISSGKLVTHSSAVPARRDTTAFGTVHVMLPAYNESRAIVPLLDAVATTMNAMSQAYSVIIVDDGSHDDTALVVSRASFRMPVDLVQHPCNQGLAAAMRTGMTTAVNRADDGDVIVTMDADNTHPPKLITGMLEMLSDGFDVVIASRYRPGAKVNGVPANRHILSFGARLLFQVAFPTRGVRDYTCGYRAYHVGPLREAIAHYGDQFITEQGFSCMAEILLKLRARGVRMGEVPLELNYGERGDASKMQVARTVKQTLSLIARRRLWGI